MTREREKRGLGRGLSALFGEIAEEVLAPGHEAPQPEVSAGPGSAAEVSHAQVAVDLIEPNPMQPRRHFDERELDELAESIRLRGVIQPVLLRPHPERADAYQLVAGERRWRAAQRAGVHEIPALVRSLDDRAVLELAIIENVQRADLNPVEEATAYRELVERFGYTQEELARVVGKSRSHVANMMRLLGLPGPVLEMLKAGQLSAGHARALLAASDPLALARETVRNGWSVRQVEARVKRAAAQKRRLRRAARAEKDPDTRLLEGELTAAIGMRVSIHHGTDGAGEVRIRYRSLDELDSLCRKLAE